MDFRINSQNTDCIWLKYFLDAISEHYPSTSVISWIFTQTNGRIWHAFI